MNDNGYQIVKPGDDATDSELLSVEKLTNEPELTIKPERKLNVKIGTSGGHVVVQFDPPQSELRMTCKAAKEFARRLSLEAIK